MKIERDTDHDETTQALTEIIADALASKTTVVASECSDGIQRVIITMDRRRFELRLVEML
jgi:hypothetical protein